MDNVSNNQQTMKKIMPKVLIIAIVLIGLVVGGKKIYHAFTHEETDNAQIEMRLVPILSRVSGYIGKIYTDDYSSVKTDQLLLVIDSTELELQLEEMQSDYNQALSDIENAKASLSNAEASLTFSKGNAEVIGLRKMKALVDFNRDSSLYESGAITEKQFDDSRSNFEINMKQMQTGLMDVHVADTRLNILRAQLTKAKAIAELKRSRIDQQKLKISYCRIYSPSFGKVGRRNVEQGQFIQIGTPLFTLVNDQKIWIIANFKENQIKNISEGQLVDIKVDGYPKLQVQGEVVSLSDATGARFSLLPPDDATGNFIKVTQRIPIKIEIKDDEKYRNILRAGMSVTVSIPIPK